MRRLIAVLLLVALVSTLACACGYKTGATTTTLPESSQVTSAISASPSTALNTTTLTPTKTSATTPSTGAVVTTTEPAKLDLVGAYLVVIDHLVARKHITAANFKYLSVDTTKLPGLTSADKARLFQGLEKYGLQLLDKTLAQLKAEGYIPKGLEFIDGAWIDLKDIRLDGPVMTLDAGIHLGGLDAYGLDDMRETFLDKRWEITYIYMTWVA